ncbi:MAG TPA: hypothetical protein V6C85_23615 [Allocoleopsis sp.]
MPLDSLNPKQSKVIILLANGTTIDDAAAEVGCSEKTIDGWLKLPHFKQALRETTTQIYWDSLAECVRATTKAVKFLLEVVDDEEGQYTATHRLKASEMILAHASKWRDWQLEERIEQLERSVDAASQSG